MSNDSRNIAAVKFNRICAMIALAFLSITLLGRLALLHSSNQDFPQYYMGGVMARAGAWDDLYPIPHDDPMRNPGFAEASDMKPRYAEESARHGLGSEMRFMQPPPFALLMTPFSLLSFKQAYIAWTIVLIIATWIIALQASRIFTLCNNDVPTRSAGIILLIIACSPAAHRWVRVENLSPIIGALLGGAVLALHHRQDARGPLYIGLGMISKYATAVLLPLYLITRRWKALLSLAIVAIAALSVSLLIMGRGPFDEYITKIAPALNRTSDIAENQGIPGLVLRLMHTNGLTSNASLALSIARIVTLLILLAFLIRVRFARWHEPPVLFAGASALIAWLLLLSPIYWEHYTAYLAPFWGWLAWMAVTSRSKTLRVGSILAIASCLAPLTIIVQQAFHRRIPEPFAEHQLLGTLLMLAIAGYTLHRARGRQEESKARPGSP